MKKFLLMIAVAAVCVVAKAQTGSVIVDTIASIHGDTLVTKGGYQFKVKDKSVYVGKCVDFTVTNISDRKNRRKRNGTMLVKVPVEMITAKN